MIRKSKKIWILFIIFLLIIIMFNYNKTIIVKVKNKKASSNIISTITNNEIVESNTYAFNIKYIKYNKEFKYNLKIIYDGKEIVNSNEFDGEIQYSVNFENEGKHNIIVILNENEVEIYREVYNLFYIKKNENYFKYNNTKGICVHFIPNEKKKDDYQKQIKFIENLGINDIRTDIYKYKYNKKENIEYYNEWINFCREKNINILLILNGFMTTIDNDEKIAMYKNFVDKLYSNYSDKTIKYIEVLNEPNILANGLEYNTDTEMNYYTKLLTIAQNEKTNNNIKIVGGVTGIKQNEKQLSQQEFIDKLGNNKGLDNIDYYSFHYYSRNNNMLVKGINNNIEKLNENGGFLKTSLSEYGISCTGEIDEEKQAKLLVQQATLIDSCGLNSSYVYELLDGGNNKSNNEENFGLLTYDYLPKKSYYSMKNYYQNTNGSEYIGQIKLMDGLEAHVYDKDGKPKIIAWATDSSKPITINYDGFTATDLYGNAIENTNGKIEITDSPVYLDNVLSNYFYQAISNSITEGYSDFNSKFKDEISKVNGLSNKINSLNQTATSLKNMSTLDENKAKNLMKSHFELGNDLINAYNNGSLNVEYVKLSSMLDSLNTIGNSYEDLVTVSAKTRMNDLTDITNEVNNANSIIENNGKLDIVYPEKIYKFSKDLLDTSSYVLGLEEENDIKTGLINSKALHAKYLANWSQEFSQSYINDKLKKPINKIIADNEVIINNTSNGISKNSDILNSYATLKNNLNNLIKNETENNLDKLNNAYTNQMSLIKLVVSKYNSNEIRINDNIYKLMIENFINLSDDYKELYELYKTDSDIISTKEVEETLNKVINRYNDNKDSTNDFSNETDIINNMTELFNGLFDRTQDSVIEVQSAENYLKKQRILKTCDIASSMLENDIKQKADVEYKAITISSDKGINNFTNQDETITINLPKSAQITSESSNGFKFNDNGTKDVKLSIRGYDYTYTIKVNNIDKTLPKVTAQNGQSIMINAIDDNLKEIKIEKDGKETAVNNGQTITTPGIYKIIATDKAGNSANETAIVYGTYTNEQNSQVNYVTIKSKTKVRDIKQDGDYTIKDNNNIANEIKRAPSSVNTNAEKDSNSYIATGDILQDNNNTYIVITLGDLSGNGDVGVADIIKLRKSLVGLTKLTKLQELAADTNQNGSVNVSDLLKERKIMVGAE